jgi:hypothetical protein
MKNADLTYETAARVTQTESANIESFRFTDLPREIQLHIFHCVSHRSPEQSTVERADFVQATVSMLLLNKAFFHFFGPDRYQATNITFRDPVTFANSFLGRCTDICLLNLRSLECRLDNWCAWNGPGVYSGPPIMAPPISVMKKLPEVLCTYRELRNLKEFRLIYIPEPYSVVGYQQDLLQAGHSTTWPLLDDSRKMAFSRLEERMLAKTFKGFSVSRGLVPYDEQSLHQYYIVKEMSLTFRSE